MNKDNDLVYRKMSAEYIPRDINRIDPLLEELKIFWKKNQDLRLGQLVSVLASYAGANDVFYVEDDKIMKILKEKNKDE